MIKYYYLDENKNKIYYSGEVVNDYANNELYGFISQFKTIKKKIELEYHPEEPAIKGWSSYFTYKDENNNIKKYEGNTFNIKKSFDGSYFVTQTKKIEIPIKIYPEIKHQDSYFTYMNEQGEEVRYVGKIPSYDKDTNTYFIYK